MVHVQEKEPKERRHLGHPVATAAKEHFQIEIWQENTKRTNLIHILGDSP